MHNSIVSAGPGQVGLLRESRTVALARGRQGEVLLLQIIRGALKNN